MIYGALCQTSKGSEPVPFRKELYPREWSRISLRIRERDEWRCGFCGLENGAVGYRDATGKFWTDEQIDRADGDHPFVGKEPKKIKIVLTVAHLDHDSTNNADGNLLSLCQSCHLRHDIDQHAANAAATRRRKRREAGQLVLIE